MSVLLLVVGAEAQVWVSLKSLQTDVSMLDEYTTWEFIPRTISVFMQDVPTQKIRITDAKGNGTYIFSELPNGQEDESGTIGVYSVNVKKGTIEVSLGGQKQTVKMKSLPKSDNGWYEYDFGRTAYLSITSGSTLNYDDIQMLITPEQAASIKKKAAYIHEKYSPALIDLFNGLEVEYVPGEGEKFHHKLDGSYEEHELRDYCLLLRGAALQGIPLPLDAFSESLIGYSINLFCGTPLLEEYKTGGGWRADPNSEEIMKTDLLPFKKLAEDGYDGMIMSAHIQFPNIELETYTSTLDGSEITLPSTLSRTFLTDILRGELGFEGPVITDAMNMDAIALHFNPQDAAALALNAGADMLLMPVAADGTESIANVDAYMSALVAMINDGTIPLTRVDEAVRRILTLKYENGIMDREYSDAQTEKMIAAVGSVGSEEHHEAEIALADEAVTVVENNGILPVAAEENMTILMVGMSASQANALGYAFNRLQESGQIPASAEGYVVDGNYSDNYGEANALLDSADLLIVTDSMYSSELIDFNANAIIPSLLQMIDTAHNNGTPVIAISCALPYDLPLLTSADALMAVYNQTGVVACDENFMPTAAYGPNIIGAMDVIFGKANPSGKLPVNIPVIENGTFTDGIAYERGTGLTW